MQTGVVLLKGNVNPELRASALDFRKCAQMFIYKDDYFNIIFNSEKVKKQLKCHRLRNICNQLLV